MCFLLDGAGHPRGYAEASVGIDPSYSRNVTITIDGALSLAADTDISLTSWNNTSNGAVDPGTALVHAADITTKSVDAASVTQETH